MFESSDLNVMLKVQKTFSQEPGATAVMKKALGLPLPLTSKLTSVQFEPEDIEKMRSLMSIMKDPRIVGAMEVAKELQLTTELGRAKFMSQGWNNGFNYVDIPSDPKCLNIIILW